jgi:hypothetical protein
MPSILQEDSLRTIYRIRIPHSTRIEYQYSLDKRALSPKIGELISKDISFNFEVLNLVKIQEDNKGKKYANGCLEGTYVFIPENTLNEIKKGKIVEKQKNLNRT